MKLENEDLSNLRFALCTYFGDRYIEELDISYNYIKPEGFKILSNNFLIKSNHL